MRVHFYLTALAIRRGSRQNATDSLFEEPRREAFIEVPAINLNDNGLCNYGKTVKKEKNGGGGTLQFAQIIFQVHCLCSFVFFFREVRGGGGDFKYPARYFLGVHNLNLGTFLNLNNWKRLQKICITPQTAFFASTIKLIPLGETQPSIRHVQVENDSNIVPLPKIALNVIFYLMFGGISFLLSGRALSAVGFPHPSPRSLQKIFQNIIVSVSTTFSL